MRLFVTGATGTLGVQTVRRLVDGGHEVVGLARSSENDVAITDLGATPVRADLFDKGSLLKAMDGCDGVCHLATKIPPARAALKSSSWHENDRIRTEGTKYLVDGALRSGVGTVVYPSICFLYADGGDRWIDESGVIHTPPMLYSAVLAEKEIERFGADGERGVILRMGSFSGPDAPNIHEALEMARKGIAPLIGPRSAYYSRIDVRDAAEAVVAAVEEAPSGIYNVVEDDPKTRGELIDDFAAAVGRKRLLSLPLWLLRIVTGRSISALARSHRVSNRAFKEATTWRPKH